MASQLAVSASSSISSSFFKKYGLLLALLAMAAVFVVPTPVDLTTSGHRMLGILVFAVIIWITEAVTYPVSATIIATLMILCLGLSPDPQDPAKLLGTSSALKMAFAGVSASGTVLVGAALFLAAAMMHTGLDKCIALFVLSKVGAKTNRILAGMIFVGFVLAFFVPSTTARVGCIVPIVLGIIAAFKMKRNSRFAALLMIATVQAASIWNIGIKTAAAQNMVALGFIDKQLGATITWGEWFVAAAPYAVAITDDKKILAFIGLGSDHHKPGHEILSMATTKALAEGEIVVFQDGAPCTERGCPLASGVVAPFVPKDKAVGTLKLYRARQSSLTVADIQLVEGLAKLLSRQLALHELDRQQALREQAEMRALRAQINPHFLFNTLSNIMSFCRTSPDTARNLLEQLSEMLHFSFAKHEDKVTVEEEFSSVEAYAMFITKPNK